MGKNGWLSAHSRPHESQPILKGTLIQNDSPRVLLEWSQALAPLQLQGIQILLYLDDWLICIPTLNQGVMDTEKVLAHIQSLGSTVNWKNSSLQPRQQVNLLGIHFDSVTMNAHLTSEGQQSGESIKTFPVRKTGEWAQITEVVWLIAAASVVIILGLLRACDIHCWFN